MYRVVLIGSVSRTIVESNCEYGLNIASIGAIIQLCNELIILNHPLADCFQIAYLQGGIL